MMATTLLLTLVSLGGVPAGQVLPAHVAVLEQREGVPGPYVPTGVAVPVLGRNPALRSADLFGRRVASGGGADLANVCMPGDVMRHDVVLLNPGALPVCRF